ncbi:MAG TPA: aminotransferase class V-fold PLP-dependent enzyme [SAR324 cluster bacterium]|jgi:selenocysteine lyase/cysteine desulfurase|nr:aminotransferase class V-fold PLP-dependent enzyme [SAR324 cluster bacterium]
MKPEDNPTETLIPLQKHLFDLPSEITYLNCCYMSPQLLSVSEAGRQALFRKQQPWNITIPDFFEETENTRRLFAELIEAEPSDIAIIPATSYGVAVAVKNLEVEPGSKILMLHEQFPSNVLGWQEMARLNNSQTVFLKDPSHSGWTEIILDAIDESTAIVALPHVHWSDGRLIDLPKIGCRCREAGAALVLDLTQSLGAIPFSVRDVQPDFMIASTYKWLLGPYSMGFLYADPKHHQGQPIEHNWIQRKNSENFAGLARYEKEFQSGARRFDVGERSNFMLMPMVHAALEQIHAWKVLKISSTLKRLTSEIAARAVQIGLRVVKENQRGPHFVGIGFPEGMPQGLLELLAKEKIFVSIRGDSMRVSPHLFNDFEDIEKLFAVLEELLT